MGQSAQTVLVVEDDLDIREALLEVLEGEGYRAVGLSNGMEAMEYLACSSVPACIVLDMMMPVMNGMQFLACSNQDPKLSNIPVIVVSAGSRLRTTDAPMRAVAVLDKPFEIDDLLGAVRRHC